MTLSTSMKSSFQAVALGFLTLGIASTSALAATATSTIAVSATVVATCITSATPMAFGNYTGVLLATSTATVSVTCTNTTPYTVALSAGSASGATVTNRSMTGPGSALLGYGLFSDSARSVNFATTASITGNGAAQPITVYGNVAGAQYVAPGAYADSITATVSY